MRRIALVTGASSGIGRSFAMRLASKGMDIVPVARRADRLEHLKRELETLGVRVRPIVADLADKAELQSLIAHVKDMPVEILVNNAGLAHYMPFAKLAPEQARELIDVNSLAPILLTRAAIPGMIERGTGSVINVASLLAFSGAAREPHLPQRAVYAATKAFLVTFTEILAMELEGTGVKAQVVCPGLVRSEFHSRQGLDMSQVPRMDPDQIVTASLADLDQGVVVSIPAMADSAGKAKLDEAGAALLRVARTTELPSRYGKN